MGVRIGYPSTGIGGLRYIGGSATVNNANTDTEITLATITIAANQLKNQFFVHGGIKISATVVTPWSGTFRLKVGATGSEATVQTVILALPTQISLEVNTQAGALFYLDVGGLNYTVENRVIITAQNSVASANKTSTLQGLVVEGN